MKQLRLYFTGKVQGVGFRSFVSKQVKLHTDLFGFTRNTDDGRVEVVLEGNEETLKDLLDALKPGSTYSVVEDMQVVWKEAEKREFFQFTVY